MSGEYSEAGVKHDPLVYFFYIPGLRYNNCNYYESE